jgi:hypothetical protein
LFSPSPIHLCDDDIDDNVIRLQSLNVPKSTNLTENFANPPFWVLLCVPALHSSGQDSPQRPQVGRLRSNRSSLSGVKTFLSHTWSTRVVKSNKPSVLTDNWRDFFGDKADGAWSWPLASNWGCCQEHIHLLHGATLN